MDMGHKRADQRQGGKIRRKTPKRRRKAALVGPKETEAVGEDATQDARGREEWGGEKKRLKYYGAR